MEEKREKRVVAKDLNARKKEETLKKKEEEKNRKTAENLAKSIVPKEAKVRKPRAKKEKVLSDKKNCFICKKLFEDDEIAAQCNWRGCEKCSNWYCFNCSNKIAPTDASADFLCLKCH